MNNIWEFTKEQELMFQISKLSNKKLKEHLITLDYKGKKFKELVLKELLYRETKKDCEYILCSAIHFNDGISYVHQPKNIETGYVICGRRHHNIFATQRILKPNKPKDVVQGFITNLDRFVDRKEGLKIALKANQTSKDGKRLISEDLY